MSLRVTDKIQQCKEENPHNVDEVPVQSADLDRRVVAGVKASFDGRPQQPGHQPKSDNHMERVKAGHEEVEAEKDLRLVEKLFLLILEPEGRDSVLLPVLMVLDGLHAQEHCPKNHRQD